MYQPATLDLWLAEAANRFGTPAYIYFLGEIETRRDHLMKTFANRFCLSFAVKSNPNPALLERMRELVDYLDISSIGEFRLAIAAGWPAKQLSFTGPAKKEEDLLEAIAGGIGEVVLESVHEAHAANRIAAAMEKRQHVLIRLSPQSIPRGFGDQMAGKPSPFGIDVEDCADAITTIAALEWLEITGFHIYAGTQCLKADAVCQNYANFISIFQDVCEAHDITPRKLVFGSGLGIPYHDSDRPIDLEAVAAETIPLLDQLQSKPRFTKSQLVLELGRYLVGEAGYFVTMVVSKKKSRGEQIAICDGGMNHNLPASGHFGMVVHRNYPMHKIGGTGDTEKVNLVGPLCTSIDRLALGVNLPILESGDLVAIHMCGAYGPSASPVHFISHGLPREILVDADGMSEITRSTY